MARTQSASGDDGPSVASWLKSAALTGLALIIPLVVTILVLTFVWGFIASLVTPLSTSLGEVFGLTTTTQEYVLLAMTTTGLAAAIILIGIVANATSNTGLEDAFDHAIESIPGIGGIYSTFNDMSDLLLDSDTQSFQEVVLVEYPNEDSYCVAFLTTETPDFVRDAVDEEEMITVFMPMGPNPFMGGFVLHIAESRVYDVDMTVEEGIQSIVTSGAAMGDHEFGEDDPQPDPTTVEHRSSSLTDGDDEYARSGSADSSPSTDREGER